ncbi:MAG: hypothetical protein HOA11_00995, partial [Euryarchaeota archaeon]|nr:hypothetical protein [Euryarchaeota archaeon]
MREGNSENPRDGVFTTVLWDGAFGLADWEFHERRLVEHAKRLRLDIPEDLTQQLLDFLKQKSGQKKSQTSLDPNMVVRIECLRTGEVSIESRKLTFRNESMDAITLPAPRWS